MIGHNKGIANVAVLKQWVIVPNEEKYEINPYTDTHAIDMNSENKVVGKEIKDEIV
jgi:hypothetical protein